MRFLYGELKLPDVGVSDVGLEARHRSLQPDGRNPSEPSSDARSTLRAARRPDEVRLLILDTLVILDALNCGV